MNIKILGNGGFYNEGLAYNALAIDGHVLVETPPDILQSLHSQGMKPSQIDTVYISHNHGDHCFGFPFFFFNWLYAEGSDSHNEKQAELVIMGPKGLKEHLGSLMRLAILPEHQYLSEFDQRVRFIEVDEKTVLPVKGGLWFGFLRTKHSVPTFSLIVGKAGYENELPSCCDYLEKALFIYSSDTSMFDGIYKLLNSSAKLILCDTNGEEENGVHMSPRELMAAKSHIRSRSEECAVLSEQRQSVGNDIDRVLGIHLSRKMDRVGQLRFAQPGEEYCIK
ncbi:MAG TPA: MBL fold metallo-hydrolase [Rectinema sp.]|jgi:ribonuclease BN (tRNA processing enzyme)|nr:MBL fold metallo-hydrolase [Rectinema sp.]HQB06613.1 MBL fold metallo-hydrolase [Rectinema sp.]